MNSEFVTSHFQLFFSRVLFRLLFVDGMSSSGSVALVAVVFEISGASLGEVAHHKASGMYGYVWNGSCLNFI